jgi:hypothetical protein
MSRLVAAVSPHMTDEPDTVPSTIGGLCIDFGTEIGVKKSWAADPLHHAVARRAGGWTRALTSASADSTRASALNAMTQSWNRSESIPDRMRCP